MRINPDGTVTIREQTFTPRFKVRGLSDVRWLEGSPQPEFYAAGGVWLPPVDHLHQPEEPHHERAEMES